MPALPNQVHPFYGEIYHNEYRNQWMDCRGDVVRVNKEPYRVRYDENGWGEKLETYGYYQTWDEAFKVKYALRNEGFSTVRIERVNEYGFFV